MISDERVFERKSKVKLKLNNFLERKENGINTSMSKIINPVKHFSHSEGSFSYETNHSRKIEIGSVRGQCVPSGVERSRRKGFARG